MAASAVSESTLPLEWPLVGRHKEVDLFSATLDDDRAHGLVIYGSAGVGKTRLADHFLAVAERAGREVARVTATEGSRSVPLGVLANVLPAVAVERSELAPIVAETGRVLQERARHGPPVWFVDDGHLVDTTSATVLTQLVDSGLVFLVATVRTGEDVPHSLESLWHRARVRRLDLHDLDRVAVDTLLHLVLRDPVEPSTSAQLWEASQGNVLFVRELVLGALGRGQLVHRHGVWRLTGPIVTTQRLHELIAARLGTVWDAAREALDVLAIWEPIGLSTLEAAVGRDQLELLDRSGLLEMRTDGRRQSVRLAHPLHGEIVRGRMPPLVRRRLLLEYVDRIEAHGARRREDPIRIATSRLDATGGADPLLLVRAARLARSGHDFFQVERFGRAAAAHGMTPEIGLLVGEALHELGRWIEADEVLLSAERALTGENEALLLVELIEMRSRNLMWGLFRDDQALEVNRAGRDRIGDGEGDEELALNEAMLLTYCGRPLEALAVLERVGEPVRRRARSLRAFAEVPALAATGRCATAADAADRAFAEQAAIPEQIAMPGEGVHMLTKTYALSECGRLEEAAVLAAAVQEATPATAPPDALMWLAHTRGRCALLCGRPETARRWLIEARARSEENNHAGPRRLVLSALATAYALLGDRRAAAAAVGELDQIPPLGFLRAEQESGRGWALVAAGDLPAARAVLRESAELAAGAGYRTAEAALLHDVARLGVPGSVVHRLTELATVCEGELVGAYAAHAQASATSDPGGLADASERFERLGAALLAAEAAAEAAQAYRRAGDQRSAAALELRSATLASSCEGARTPALAAPVTIVPLTSRERDIAILAAGGASSRAIADQLFLSVRTVNNHLQRVYSKLGVRGRRELADALTDVDTSD